MPTPVIMPKFGMSQEDATVISWRCREGDRVEKGEPILDVETDKTSMEVEAPESGILAGIRVREGDVVPVTQVIAYILAAGETLPEAGERVDTPGTEPAARPQVVRQATPLARRVAESLGIDLQRIPLEEGAIRITRQDVERYLKGELSPSTNDRRRATPAARRRSRETGMDLAQVQGSGPRGRIQEADVTAAEARAGGQHQAVEGMAAGGTVVPLEGVHRKIAERMQRSYQTAPHVTFSVEVDMAAALELLTALNARGVESGEVRLSVTAFLVKASAWALKRHPWVNASLVGEEIHLHPEIHIGVAVARPEGLIVPVIKNADRLSLGEIAARMEDLTGRARANRLVPDEVVGGTFTISNLGMYGIKHFTAIINPPQSAILAVGAVEKVVKVEEGAGGDEIVVRPTMMMTLSADHRVLDGARAASFLKDLVEALEEPGLLLY